MKRMKVLAVLSGVALLVAATAWAGGAACAKDADAAGKMAKAEGGHCDMGKGAQAMAKCTLGANQMVYSFAVPTAECDHCVDGISKAAMAQAGIHCVHVDLKSRVAYIVADKKMDKNALAKCMKEAGFKNSYRGDGKNVRAALVQYMAASPDACCKSKAKDKV